MSRVELHDRYDLYRHVLFCTDFSENADFAFGFAVEAASRRPGARLSILHVIHAPDAQFWKTYLYEVDDVDEKARRDIDAKVDREYLAKLPEGVKATFVPCIGQEAPAILEYAEAEGVDLIVMGRQGHSEVTKVFFGNVTEKVVRKATCPVLVIPMAFQEAVRKPDN